MGWGTKKAAAPQPAPMPRIVGKSPLLATPYGTKAKREPLDVETVLPEGTLPTLEEAIEDAKDRKSDSAKAQVAWHELKSRKGWTEATIAMLLYEFIVSRGLVGELVKAARRR